MRCSECSYELTESEQLLCMIPGGHYCPQCWAKISLPEESTVASGRSTGAQKTSGVRAVTELEKKIITKGDEPTVDIEVELCKGCEFCVDVCPEECLAMADIINSRGYLYALYEGERCTGCGICYYNCPEPGAITVYKGSRRKKEVSRG